MHKCGNQVHTKKYVVFFGLILKWIKRLDQEKSYKMKYNPTSEKIRTRG